MKPISFDIGYRQPGRHLTRILSCLFLLLISSASAMCSEPERLVYLSGQTTFYAGREYSLGWRAGKDFWDKADAFQVKMISANKTVFQKTTGVDLPLRMTFRYPEIRPGVVIEATIIIAAYYQGRIQRGIYSQNLFFYSQEHPFFDAQMFTKSDIGVYDRTGRQAVKKLLTRFQVLGTRTTDTSNLPGKWLVCSGLDFQKQPGLFSEFNDILRKGVSILILSPVAGKFILPAFKSGNRIALADQDIFPSMDKRIHLETVRFQISPPETTFQITSIGNQPGIVAQPESEGFGWLEIKTEKSRMIFCGWNLLEIFEQNPSAGILLNHLLTGH